MALDLENGIKEVLEKSEAQIERESAWKWAEKAAACFKISEASTTIAEKLSWLVRGFDNRHESQEHSALGEDEGLTLKEVNEQVDFYKDLAIESLANFLKV